MNPIPHSPTPQHIMELGSAYWASKTLLSAVELGLFTVLAEGPLDCDALSTRLGIHPRAARDFFDALVALRMLERNGGLYNDTPDTFLYLDRNKPSYVGGILEMSSTRLFQTWGSLTGALKTGEPQNDSKNAPDAFAALYATDEKTKSFLRAMTAISLGPARVIAQKVPWKEYQSVIDIGTAQGALPVQVALANSHLSGGGFDLPKIRPHFEEYVRSHGLQGRLQFCPGDFFNDPLPSADVLVMGHILHDWNLEEKKSLLASAYKALPKGGSLIVYEALIDDERRENAFGLLMSLNMLIETKGGFDFTGADCMSWMQDAGFQSARVEHLVGPDSMVIGVK